MVLTLVIAESSVELVPHEITNHPAVLKWARRKKKNPGELILDQNYHYSAMKKQGLDRRKGRPDIVHLCLLAGLGSPLNLDGGLRCVVHTREDKVIRVDPKTRLPRNTDRFVALLEQLYKEHKVPKDQPPLLTLEDATVTSLLSNMNSDSVIALTTEGTPMPMPDVANRLAMKRAPVLVVGGFAEGHFSRRTSDVARQVYRIDARGLEAWIVVARAIYDYERAIKPRAT